MAGKQPDITVVVVTYNRAEMLRRALTTLVLQVTEGRFSFEILVIDDGSTDATAALVRAIASQAKPLAVRYVYKEGGGEGGARNRGVAEARGHWVAFCDDDQLADARWLSELYNAAREKGVHGVGGSVALMAPDAGGVKLGTQTRGFLGEKWLSPNLKPHDAKYCLGAGNLLMQRSVFKVAGGFDAALRQGVDTDFFWRVERAGFSLGAAPHALVYHVTPASRQQPAYLRGVCLRKGVATLHIQWKYEGPVKVILAMLRRLGIGLAIDVPLLLLGQVFHDAASALGSRCRLWYKWGFIRGALFSLAPQLFPQTRFFRELDSGFHGATRK